MEGELLALAPLLATTATGRPLRGGGDGAPRGTSSGRAGSRATFVVTGSLARTRHDGRAGTQGEPEPSGDFHPRRQGARIEVTDLDAEPRRSVELDRDGPAVPADSLTRGDRVLPPPGQQPIRTREALTSIEEPGTPDHFGRQLFQLVDGDLEHGPHGPEGLTVRTEELRADVEVAAGLVGGGTPDLHQLCTREPEQLPEAHVGPRRRLAQVGGELTGLGRSGGDVAHD